MPDELKNIKTKLYYIAPIVGAGYNKEYKDIEGCEKIINWLASYIDKKGNDIEKNIIYSIYKIEPVDGEYHNIYIEIKQKESKE